MVAPGNDVDLCRAELDRILASPEFASSRQLQDFLRYTSERAFLGESHLDQNEIASAVLRRGNDFDPAEDAGVRKMASQVRQRLEHYYSQPGRSHGVVVSLPVRCYVPKFNRHAHVDGAAAEGPAVANPPRIRLWTGIACGAAVAALAMIALWGALRIHPSSQAPDNMGAVELWTVRGDIYSGVNDAPGRAVLLGPKLRAVDEITGRMEFTPNREAQQAGLIVWQDGQHFIRLGRKFFGRNEFEFLLEEGRSSFNFPGNIVYDPDGQSGQPVWLSIRRRGSSYQAFLSRDGIAWKAHGQPIVPRLPFASPRAGVYALNGRRDAPSMPARFHHLATGWTFDGSTFPPATGGDWIITNTCPATTTVGMEAPALRIDLAAGSASCSFGILRPLGGRDWEISTRMDSFPLPGLTSGLRLEGSKGGVRLGRYFLNGPSISFINESRTLLGMPDLNGSPAIFLRLTAHNGMLTAAYSADGENYQRLPVNMKVEDLGTDLIGGLRFSTSPTNQENISSTARFYSYRESIGTLVPYR